MKILRLLIYSSIQASSYKSKLDSEMPSYVCVTFNCLWIKDRPQSIHKIRAGNLTKFNESFTISRILIVFLASIAKLCKTEPPKSLPILLKGAQLRLSLKVIEGHGGLGTRLNFDTSREEQLGRNVTLTKAPAYIGESPGKEIDF